MTTSADTTATPSEALKEDSQKNNSKIGFLPILLITINSIMGTGIFFLPAIGAREAGLFGIISWAIMGVIAIYYSTIFAELIGFIPKEGGVYEYAKMAFGPFASFILGWMTLIASNVTIAMLMVGAIKYIGPVLPNAVLIIISIIFICLFNFMAFRGLKTSTVMLVAFALITLTAVGGILIPGLISFNTANFTGWFAHPAFSSLSFSSFAGLFGGASIIFLTIFFIAETFFGWETATFLAEKVKNPKKVMPKVMIRATIIIAVLSLLFVLASHSLIHWEIFAQSATPLSDLATVVYGAIIGKWYAVLVYLAIIGSVAGWVVAAPNLIVALAKDKLFIPQLSRLHKKYETPYRAIIFQAILTSILVVVGAGSYETLLHLLVPLVLVLYASVVLSLLFIRKKYPGPRPYTAPFGTIGPILLLVFTFGLIGMWLITVSYAIQTVSIIGSFLLISLPLFLLLFFHYDPQATLRFKNATSSVSFIFESLFLPKKIRTRILANATISNQRILELGAGSGLISRRIAKRNPKKQIIIEQTQSLAKLIKRRTKAEHDVQIFVDPHIVSRIHPNIDRVDEVFSFGLLSEVQSIEKFVNELADLVFENSRIHFFDYVDLYKVLPDKELLDDFSALEKLFRKAGFAVRIEKQKGLFWNYLIIDGIKTSQKDVVFV
ncbi:MAG: amino acid permease [Candidatus Nanoarchaeia archaeon]